MIVDERVTGWGRVDADAFVAHLQQLIDLAPDALLTCIEVHTTAPHGSVERFRVTGTVPGGGEFELLFETMSVAVGDQLVRLELLPEGKVAEARRRLAAAAPSETPVHRSDTNPSSGS